MLHTFFLGKDEVLRGMFLALDCDGSGFIEINEAKRLVESWSNNWDDEIFDKTEMTDMFLEFNDSNNDGKINYEEFIAWRLQYEELKKQNKLECLHV